MGTPIHPPCCPDAQHFQHLMLCGHLNCLASICSSTSWTLQLFPQGYEPLQTLMAEPTLAQSGQTQVFSAQEVSHFSPGGICLGNHCHKTNRGRLCLEGLGPCGSTTELHDPGRSSKCDSPGGSAVLPSTDSYLLYAESIAPFLITSEGGLCLIECGLWQFPQDLKVRPNKLKAKEPVGKKAVNRWRPCICPIQHNLLKKQD